MIGPWIVAVVALVVACVALVVGARSTRPAAAAPLLPSEFFDAQRAQADAIRLMADRTAEGLRAANGTYVFALRDRFDEALPAAVLGVADTSWAALGDAPGEVEDLVFHAGDSVRFIARLACNQTPGKRSLTLRWLDADGVLPAPPTILTAGGRDIGVEAGSLPSDTTAFLDLPVDRMFTDDDLVGGVKPLAGSARAELTVTDQRAEGAVTVHELIIRVVGHLYPDDDGVAIETPAIEVTIGEERRRWYLDKASGLGLALPGAAIPV
jgi:hypothetical protein